LVKYRDVGHILPVVMQLLLYGTPVAYSLSKVPAAAMIWVNLNPLTAVMVGMRWSLLGTTRPGGPAVAWSAGAGVILLCLGIAVFSRMERQFADVI
jgi:lipopolysaccharide transport system permease protein